MKINSVPWGQFFCHAGIGRMAIARLNKNRDKRTVPPVTQVPLFHDIQIDESGVAREYNFVENNKGEQFIIYMREIGTYGKDKR